MYHLPNAVDALHALQSEPDKGDWFILASGSNDTGVVGDTCVVSAQGAPNMTVAVASGTCIVGGTQAAVASGNLTIAAADAIRARFDLIAVTSSGTKSVIQGTAATAPVYPTHNPLTQAILAAVYVPALTTTITNAMIIDKRVIVKPAGSGGGGVPTGTGFTHITAGVQDAAAKLVDTADMNNSQVTLAKIANISSGMLLGRATAGSGVIEPITLGTNLSYSGTTLNAAVTSTVTLYQVLAAKDADQPATSPGRYVKRDGTNFPYGVIAFVVGEAVYWLTDALSYVSGNITVQIPWWADSAVTGNVKWEVAIAALTPNTDIGSIEAKAFATAQSVEHGHLGTNAKRPHLPAALAITNLDSLAADDIMVVRLKRIAASASEMVGDAWVPYIRLAYSA